MNFAVSVVHCTDDILAAADFLCKALGFQHKEITGNAVIVENGAITIRLIKRIDGLTDAALTLEFQTQDIGLTIQQLMTYENVRLVNQDKGAEINHQGRVEAFLQASYGLNVLLVQEFNEDQTGIMPALPSELIWDEEADLCTRRMLKLVPITFRQSARIRVTERAEMLAGEVGSVTVSLDTAVRALVQTTPLFQRPSLQDALQEEGIETGNYFEEPVV